MKPVPMTLQTTNGGDFSGLVSVDRDGNLAVEMGFYGTLVFERKSTLDVARAVLNMLDPDTEPHAKKAA